MTHVNVSIRPFQDDDEPAVVRVWHRSGQAAYAFLPSWQTLTLDRAGTIFREVILGQCNVWVGTLEQQVVAYLAMKGSYIDRMFVDPSQWLRAGERVWSSSPRAFLRMGWNFTHIGRTMPHAGCTRGTVLGR